MTCPPGFLDLNLVEHLWDVLDPNPIEAHLTAYRKEAL